MGAFRGVVFPDQEKSQRVFRWEYLTTFNSKRPRKRRNLPIGAALSGQQRELESCKKGLGREVEDQKRTAMGKNGAPTKPRNKNKQTRVRGEKKPTTGEEGHS